MQMLMCELILQACIVKITIFTKERIKRFCDKYVLFHMDLNLRGVELYI